MKPPREIAVEFAPQGEVTAIETFGGGLINDTWLVSTGGGRFVLQRINRNAFPDPGSIIENLEVLFAHVRRRQRREHGRQWDLVFPRLLPTGNGAPLMIDENGDAWRALSCIENTRSTDKPRDVAEGREAGRGLGRFHALTFDLDTRRLHQTRPDFHDTPGYLQRLRDCVTRADPRRRDRREVGEYLEFVENRAAIAGALQSAVAAGLIRRQPVHGDPKLDNFLFDADSGRVVSLIDLDTFQSGIVLHDIADCLRSCCNSAGESPAGGHGIVRFDPEICRAVLDGYFEQAKDAAAAIETDHLMAAIRLIPFELGMRFLTDYLNGDRYFRIEYPDHNLHRAGIQFQLVEDIERRQKVIRGIVADRGRRTQR